jgi:hypothetical protein
VPKHLWMSKVKKYYQLLEARERVSCVFWKKGPNNRMPVCFKYCSVYFEKETFIPHF